MNRFAAVLVHLQLYLLEGETFRYLVGQIYAIIILASKFFFKQSYAAHICVIHGVSWELRGRGRGRCTGTVNRMLDAQVSDDPDVILGRVIKHARVLASCYVPGSPLVLFKRVVYSSHDLYPGPCTARAMDIDQFPMVLACTGLEWVSPNV